MLHQVQPKIQPSHTSGQRESEQESKLCPFKTLPVSSSMGGGRNQTPQTDLEGPGVLGRHLLSRERALTLLLSDLCIGVSSEE